MENNLTMIHTVAFSELNVWDVKTFFHLTDIFNKKYPVVLFGEFLKKPQIDKVQIKDCEEYKILGARAYGKGAFVNRIVKGKTLKMRTYQQAKVNHLFWCKVDTKNGAFGIITEDLADGVGSSNMTFAKIDTTKANPEFVQLLFGSKKINEYMDGYVSGTTNRKYIKPDQLRDEIKIVLPPISEQNRLVDNYNKKIKLAEEQEARATKLKNEIQDYIEGSLKIKETNKEKRNQGLQFIQFKDTSRWDSLFLIGNIPAIDSKYPIVTFESVISSFNKGANGKSIRINSKDFPKEDFRFIGMEHIEKETGRLIEFNKVKGKEIKSQTLRVPKNFLMFGKLRSYLNKYWLNNTDYDNIICSSEFFVFDVIDSIDKMFFKYVLSSNFIQSQIADKTSGARMPRINETIFFNLKFPLPPLEEQIYISNQISSWKMEMLELTQKAEQNRTTAINDFEQEIFKN
tara:strand:+ start:1240 stop:2610 length:1371 start_codon:yes stop_codon:yes gene_type:complete